MADVQVTSGKLSLNWQDIFKGAIVAVIMAAMTTIEQAISAGVKIDWALVGSVSAGTLVAYLAKNFFTGATVQKAIPNAAVADTKAAIADGADVVIKP